MSRQSPAAASAIASANDNGLPIYCPACDRDGEIDDAGGELRLTFGFAFDEARSPQCVICKVPAGVVIQL